MLWLGAVGPVEVQAAVSQACLDLDTFARPHRCALGKKAKLTRDVCIQEVCMRWIYRVAW